MHLEIKQTPDKIEIVSTAVVEKLYDLSYENESTDTVSKLDETSTVSGHIQANAAYEDSVVYLHAKFPNLHITIPNNNYYIRFKDKEAERVCIAKWGDDVGVTKRRLETVSDIHSLFWNNFDVKSLEDLANFTSATLNVTELYGYDESNIENYYGRDSSWINRTYSNPFVTQLVKVKMPHASLNYNEYIFRSRDNRTKMYLSIDWNGATIQNTNNNSYGAVFFNCKLDWDDSLIPQQTDFSNITLFRGCVLNKCIFREGITKIYENFNATAVSYIEFPTTTTAVGGMFYSFRQDSRAVGAVSNTGCVVIKAVTPPALSSVSGSYVRDTVWVAPQYIYVPDNSVDAYKTATGWSTTELAKRITPMSQMTSQERSMGTVTTEDINRV